jgi:hypothetical protein
LQTQQQQWTAFLAILLGVGQMTLMLWLEWMTFYVDVKLSFKNHFPAGPRPPPPPPPMPGAPRPPPPLPGMILLRRLPAFESDRLDLHRLLYLKCVSATVFVIAQAFTHVQYETLPGLLTPIAAPPSSDAATGVKAYNGHVVWQWCYACFTFARFWLY